MAGVSAIAGRPSPRTRLLRQRDFRCLWAADAVSQVGTRVSFLAIPLLAVSVLDASAFEVSLLRFASTVGYLLLGLQIGAWCDRARCLPLLVASDLGRGLIMVSIPVAAAFEVLTLGQVFVVVFVAGLLTVLFDVAHQSYLPRLIAREHLVWGNTSLQANRSIAAVGAPSLGGYLVQWLSAPVAILADAVSYLWSAAFLRAIRTPEKAPESVAGKHLRREIAEGLRFVYRNPALRAIGGHGACMAFFQAAHSAVSVVFLVREVGLSPGTIGIVGSVGLVGAVLAAATTRRLSDRYGAARMLWIVAVISGAVMMLYPFTAPGWGLAWCVVSGFGLSYGIVFMTIVQVSFQQAICSERVLGRVSATMTFLVWGAIPLGSVFGGLLASEFGLPATLWIAAVGVLLSALWFLFSPIRTMRDLPVSTFSDESRP